MQSFPNQAEIARRQEALANRISAVRERMAAAGGAHVSLLAVSKGHPVEAVIAASNLGITALGESYAQELAAKANLLATTQNPSMEWHFVGQLQTNKVRQLVDHVAVWQSVDRIKVGREIAKRSPGATVFAQVNLSSEPQKAGCSFSELGELVQDLQNLDLAVEGLMGVGTAGDDLETSASFARLRQAVDTHNLSQCSMGMTADLELAIREGSTMVRIGSDLFGPRP